MMTAQSLAEKSYFESCLNFFLIPDSGGGQFSDYWKWVHLMRRQNLEQPQNLRAHYFLHRWHAKHLSVWVVSSSINSSKRCLKASEWVSETSPWDHFTLLCPAHNSRLSVCVVFWWPVSAPLPSSPPELSGVLIRSCCCCFRSGNFIINCNNASAFNWNVCLFANTTHSAAAAKHTTVECGPHSAAAAALDDWHLLHCLCVCFPGSDGGGGSTSMSFVFPSLFIFFFWRGLSCSSSDWLTLNDCSLKHFFFFTSLMDYGWADGRWLLCCCCCDFKSKNERGTEVGKRLLLAALLPWSVLVIATDAIQMKGVQSPSSLCCNLCCQRVWAKECWRVAAELLIAELFRAMTRVKMLSLDLFGTFKHNFFSVFKFQEADEFSLPRSFSLVPILYSGNSLLFWFVLIILVIFLTIFFLLIVTFDHARCV